MDEHEGMNMSEQEQVERCRSGGAGRWLLGVLFKVVLPVVVLVGAALGAKKLIDTAPKSPRRPTARQAKLVEVVTTEPQTRRVVVEAMGAVRPAQEVALKAQVSGRVEWVADNLEPGGRFEAGEVLLEIERRDFELAVSEGQSAVLMAQASVVEAGRQLTDARSNLKLEMGSQSVAQREYELLGDEVDGEQADLVLRRPQLAAAQAKVRGAEAGVASAEAALAAARSRLENSQLDLERTRVKAPFALVVEEKLVDVGDTVNTSTVLARLVGTEAFWVELLLPEGELRWVDAGDGSGAGGSEVRLYNEGAWSGGAYRMGRVIRLLPTVDALGRQARVLVSVPNPLGLAQGEGASMPLLVGSYIKAEIMGEELSGVYVVGRELVRGNEQVWVMTDENRLEVRRVGIVYRGEQCVLVNEGLSTGERLVTTDLSAGVDGMALRLAGEEQVEDKQGGQRGKGGKQGQRDGKGRAGK